jgi:cupin superfamily acireductone dioxygenase involved in methionine salvage
MDTRKNLFYRSKKDKVMYYLKDRLKINTDIIGAAMCAASLQNMMLTYFEVQPFSKFDEHSHESEQITCVLEGELYFETPEGTIKVMKGEVIAIPSNVLHTVFSKDKFVKAVDAWQQIAEYYEN